MSPSRRALSMSVMLLIVSVAGSRAEAAFINFGNTILASNAFHESACPGGDAGNAFDAACFVNGVLAPYDGFAGDIGGGRILDVQVDDLILVPIDFVDIFAFHWIQTGDFIANSNTDIVFAQLFFHPTAAPVPGDIDADPWDIHIPNLAAGDYYLRLDAGVDPPYVISLLNANGGPNANITAIQAPEPATLAIFGLGLAAVAARRRRRPAR